jgi:Uma2 family endonuclease
MTIALRVDRQWTADGFVQADQHQFGPLWRYELIEGRIVGHAAPASEHGAILFGLTGALHRAIHDKGLKGCRGEAGSAATPRTKQRNTARIPDLMVRCGEHPRVAFEVVSPSEIRNWRGRDLKLEHLQHVEGMQEIVELFQADYACHVYRHDPATGRWTFEAIGGAEAVLRLESIGIDLLLADIYEFASLPLSGQEGAEAP